VLSILKTLGAAIFALLASTLFVKFLVWWIPSLSIIFSKTLEESFGAWCIAGMALFVITKVFVELWIEENSEWIAGRGNVLITPRPWWLRKVGLPKVEREHKPHQPGAFARWRGIRHVEHQAVLYVSPEFRCTANLGRGCGV
jgi:hypothetical protein